MSEIIKIKNLTYYYGKNKVLEDVNLSVTKGEFVGVVGSNGAGKSTLIKLMTGILKVQNGNIQISDTEKGTTPTISYLSQMQDKRTTDFPATVLEIVMLGMYLQIGPLRFAKKIHRQKALHTLSKVGMEKYAKRMISQLSGGQRQKVMLAKALVAEPDILVLDEPTTGVDKDSSEAIYEILKNVNEKLGVTVVIISHDIKKLKKYCKTLYEIEYGKIKKYDV